MLNKIIYCLLIGVIVYLAFQGWQKDNALKKLEMENLQNNTLVSNLQNQITIEKNRIKIIYKNKDRIFIRYITTDGKTTITTNSSGETSIEHNWIGFCCKPWLGVSTSPHLLVGADLVYLNSLGLSAGLGLSNAMIGIDYNFSFLNLHNCLIGIGYDGNLIGYLSVFL